MTACFICQKHKNLKDFTGDVLAEKGGWLMTHFPKLEDQPTTRGHLLIETARHITDLTELNTQEASALGALVAAGAYAIKAELKAEHVYMFRINDKVPHLHVHLVPRYPNTPKEFWGTKIMEFADSPKVSLQEIRQISSTLKNKIRT